MHRLGIFFRHSVTSALCCILVLSALPALISTAQAQPALGPTEPEPPAVALSGDSPGIAALRARARDEGMVRIIVGLAVPVRAEGTLSPAGIAAQRASIRAAQETVLSHVPGVTIKRRYMSIPSLALEVTEQDLLGLIDAPGVVAIAEDGLGTTALKDSTRVINARRMWRNGHIGSDWAVAVLDTGIMYNHRAFDTSRIVASACFSSNSAQSQSLCPGGVQSSTRPRSARECPVSLAGCGHGTHVAATIAGERPARFQGVAPGANLIPIQIFSEFSAQACGGGNPCARYYNSDLMAALEHVLLLSNTHKIAAVNMSLQGGRYYQACSNVVSGFTQLTENLTSRGILLVAASGNSGWSDSQAHPSCDPWVVSVGATNNNDAVAGFTNLLPVGPWLMAPGVGIEAAHPPGRTDRAALNGTSMASPHVAGAVAMLRSIRPNATAIEIYAALFCSGTPVARPGLPVAFPRIDLPPALRALRRGTTC